MKTSSSPRSNWRSVLLALFSCALVLSIGAAAEESHPTTRIPTLVSTQEVMNTASDEPTPDVPRVQPNTVFFDRLGIEAPVIYTEATSEAGFQEALKDGIVHYPGTAMPGELGNAYFFGHSSDYPWSGGHYKTVFAKLPSAVVGDVIILSDADGIPYRYVVTDREVIAKDNVSVLDQYEYKKRLLTLQTSYPVGTALARFIVVAELQPEPTSEQGQ